MLRITVEIWPGGDKTRSCAIAIANVANLPTSRTATLAAAVAPIASAVALDTLLS